MSQTNSALMNIITQFTKQFVDKISELENTNNQLRLQLEKSSTVNKADFDKLNERHNELKASYVEIERENNKLRQDMEQLIAQQHSLETDISKYFNQVFSTLGNNQTPLKPKPLASNTSNTPNTPNTSNNSNHTQFNARVPSQTPAYRNSKSSAHFLNSEYESDSELSESDDEQLDFVPRKLRFAPNYSGNLNKDQNLNKSFMQNKPENMEGQNKLNLSDILHQDDPDNDNYESILKQIITEGLMNGLDNLNRGSNEKTQNSNNSNTSSKIPTKTTENTQVHNPFAFMFGPQNTNTQQANTTKPTSEEAQMVQKIIESILNPQTK
jgi:hypothetical protein